MIHNKTINRLFSVLTMVNLIFILNPLRYNSKFLSIYASVENFNQTYLKYILVFNMIVFLFILLNSKLDLNNILVRLIVILSVFYMAINWYHGTLAHYYSLIALPISYLTIFYVLPKYSTNRKLLLGIYGYLLVWALYPLIITFLNPNGWDAYHFMDKDGLNTFKGFAYHRNVYGFYVGVTLLLTLFINKPAFRYYKVVIALLLTIGIVLSESRSTSLAAYISALYYLIKSGDKGKVYYLYASVITLALFTIFGVYILPNSVRGIEQLLDISDRIFINSTLITRHSDHLIFGNGVGTLLMNTTNNDISAHNFVVQTILDYGIFIALLFFLILYKVWSNAGVRYQTLLLFLVLVGLSQPYFSFGVPTYFTLMTLLIAQSAEKGFSTPATLKRQT
jgi:hypothetical protein